MKLKIAAQERSKINTPPRSKLPQKDLAPSSKEGKTMQMMSNSGQNSRESQLIQMMSASNALSEHSSEPAISNELQAIENPDFFKFLVDNNLPNLWQIAKHFNLDYQQLLNLNKHLEPTNMHKGDIVYLPEGTLSEKPEKKEQNKTEIEKDNDSSVKKIAFTFDDGPIAGITEQIVNMMSGMHAMFFLTGENLSNKDEQFRIVNLILKNGHQIGNHSYEHSWYTPKYLDALDNPEKMKDFVDNFVKNAKHFQKLFEDRGMKFPGFEIARLTGSGSKLKDKEGERITKFSDRLERDLGLVSVSWTYEFAPNGVLNHVNVSNWNDIKGVAADRGYLPKNGDVILLHDRHWKGRADKLKQLINFLKSKGYSFGKISKSGTVE